MSGQFKAGDICIGQNFVVNTEYNGMECTVIGGLSYRFWENPETGERGAGILYLVNWSSDGLRTAYPHTLRKKDPPRSAKSIMREAILKAKQPVMEPA